MLSGLSIRWWLGGLVAAVAVPLLLMAVLLYASQERRERRDAQQTALRIAKATAARLTRLNAESVALAGRMAAQLGAHPADARSCESLFAIVDLFPRYADLFLFDSQGRLVCSAAPRSADRKRSDVARQWAESQLRAGRLPAHTPQILPIETEYVSLIAAPIAGATSGTLVLLELPELLGSEPLPPGAILTILDRDGKVIARSTDARRWSGQNVRTRVTQIAMREKEGVTEGTGIDGVARQYGFTFLPDSGWYIYVGVPTAAVMAPVRQSFIRAVAGGSAIVLIMLVIAATLSRAIQRPVRALARATESLAQGGYGKVAAARAPLEIVRLADSFNEMVDRRELSERKMKALSERLLLVQEEERTRIARELHDDLGQSLTALKMDVLGLLESHPATEQSPIRNRIIGNVEAMVTAVQRISSELRPSVLDDLGLIAAIEAEAQLFEERTGIECALSLQLSAPIDGARTTAIYRIAQEAFTNVARHSNAARVELRLRDTARELLLEITDDGRGVTAAEIGDPLSLGLIGIRERAALIGGTAQFDGVAGRGTIVSVRIPLDLAT
jgi:signal transduction histidine kinase